MSDTTEDPMSNSNGRKTRVVGLLAGTRQSLAEQVEETLRGVPPEHVITVSYAVSRVLGLSMTHHALVVFQTED
jgi:hypothetical protein